MGELGSTMRDAATTFLLLLSTIAVVSSRDGFPWSLLLQRLRSSRQGGRDSRQGGRNVGNDNGDDGEEMNIKMLRMSVPGEPGVDYPVLATVPSTSFSCVGKAEGGYYADMETGCQVVHTCGGGSKVVNKFSFIKYSALCSNGTIYSQEMGTCHWWYLVDCESSEKYYFNQNNIRVDSSQSSVQQSNGGSTSFSSSVQGQSGSVNQNGQASQGQGGGSSSSFNTQSSVGGQSFSLVPVGALPPIRFPGASQNEINSNIINSATTEIAFYSADDFNFDYLTDYLDEAQQLTTSSTSRPRRPKPGFFEPREPPKQLSYHHGKIIVED